MPPSPMSSSTGFYKLIYVYAHSLSCLCHTLLSLTQFLSYRRNEVHAYPRHTWRLHLSNLPNLNLDLQPLRRPQEKR